MKKIFFTLALLGSIVTASMADSRVTTRSTPAGLFNFGVGLSNRGIPVYGGLEFYTGPNFTLGGQVGYQAYTDHYHGYDYRISIVTLGAVGNFHFNNLLNIPEPWDFYAGLNLGFAITDISTPHLAPDYDNSDVSGLALGLQIGGRYYFSPRWGVNLEVGGGNIISGVKLGLTCRF